MNSCLLRRPEPWSQSEFLPSRSHRDAVAETIWSRVARQRKIDKLGTGSQLHGKWILPRNQGLRQVVIEVIPISGTLSVRKWTSRKPLASSASRRCVRLNSRISSVAPAPP